VPGAGAADAPPVPAVPVGVDTNLFGLTLGPLEQHLTLMKAGGLSAVRQDFPWARIEPARATFDWTAADTFMAAASSVGISTLVTLDYSTSWASPGSAGSQFDPPDSSDFADFAAAIAGRYGPHGSFWSTHPHITQPLHYVEVWNEPWSNLFWQPEPDPDRYVQLARAVAEAVHPFGVKVLISGDLLETRADHHVPPWLADVLAADPTIPTWVDGFSVHPYPAPGDLGPASPVPDPRFGFQRLALIRQLLAAHGCATTPIWVTEIGWSTADSVGRSVSEGQAATDLVQAVRLAFGTYGVAAVFIFTWQDPADPSSSAAGYGLRRSDGSFKPGWRALEGLLGTASDPPAR